MRLYCENCKLWSQERHDRSMTPDDDGCTYVQREDMERPIRPTLVYGNYRYLNEDGDCKHYSDMKKGLGMAADVDKNRIEFADIGSPTSRKGMDDDEKEVDET